MTVILLSGTNVVLTSCWTDDCAEDDTCFGYNEIGMCSAYDCWWAYGSCENSDNGGSGCEDAGSCPNHSGTGYMCPTYDPNSGATAPCDVDPGGIGNG